MIGNGSEEFYCIHVKKKSSLTIALNINAIDLTTVRSGRAVKKDTPRTDTLSDGQRNFFVEAFRETISREKERVSIQNNYVRTEIDENETRLCLRDPGRTTWRSRRFATQPTLTNSMNWIRTHLG